MDIHDPIASFHYFLSAFRISASLAVHMCFTNKHKEHKELRLFSGIIWKASSNQFWVSSLLSLHQNKCLGFWWYVVKPVCLRCFAVLKQMVSGSCVTVIWHCCKSIYKLIWQKHLQVVPHRRSKFMSKEKKSWVKKIKPILRLSWFLN